MAVLGVNNPTLADVAKTLNPDGSIAKLVELLNETNEILEDVTFIEGNLPTGHRTSIRTGLPTVTWRKLYGGVQPSKSTSVQVTDSCGMLEAYSQVDKKLAALNGNSAAWRLTEEVPFIESMNQEMTQTLFYGNEGLAPEEFTGLAPRYNSLSAENALNIIDAGADLTDSGADSGSIWLVVWGPNTVHGIYPKGSQAGLSMEDLGQKTMVNADGSMYEVLRTHFQWDAGLSVRDWRYVVRIANIDSSQLNTVANTALLVKWMMQATERIPNFNMGRPVFYMNRRMREMLRLGIQEKIAGNMTWETVAGKRAMMFDGIPVRRCDQLLFTETSIT